MNSIGLSKVYYLFLKAYFLRPPGAKAIQSYIKRCIPKVYRQIKMLK